MCSPPLPPAAPQVGAMGLGEDNNTSCDVAAFPQTPTATEPNFVPANYKLCIPGLFPSCNSL